MRRRIGSRAVSWLVVAAMFALPIQGFALTVNTADIANGAVTTDKIADGAVTASKFGIVCSNGEYLQYVFGSGWVCSVGTAGPVGPQGPVGSTGAEGPAGSTPHYANVVVVAKSGGDFTDITGAINSITDATVTNPYLVKIMPGIYQVADQTIIMKSFVDVEGSGQNVTKITGLRAGGAGLVHIAYNSELRNLTVETTGYAGNSVSQTLSTDNYITVAPFGTIMVSDVNVINTATGSGSKWGMLYFNANVILKNVNIYASSVSGDTTGIEAMNSTTKADNLSITSNSSNVAIGVFANYSNFVMKNSSINAVGPYSTAVRNNIASDQPLGHTYIVNTVIESGVIYGAAATITCAGIFDGAYNFFANTCL